MSLTFHYPKEPESDHQSIIEKAWQIVKYFGYVPTQGFCAIEAGPPIQWTKGKLWSKQNNVYLYLMSYFFFYF